MLLSSGGGAADDSGTSGVAEDGEGGGTSEEVSAALLGVTALDGGGGGGGVLEDATGVSLGASLGVSLGGAGVSLLGGSGVALGVSLSGGVGASVSMTVVGSGVDGFGTRDVTVTWAGALSVTWTAVVAIWASAGARLVTVSPSADRVCRNVVGPRLEVLGSTVLPTIGSQAPAPMLRPSCSMTVGCELRYSTIVGGTRDGFGTSASGMTRLEYAVGSGRSRIRVSLTQDVAIGSTVM